MEIELDNGGAYQFTLNASGPASVVFMGDDGPAAPFLIDADAAGTTTCAGDLAAGGHRLDMRSGDSWSVTLLFLG